MVILESSKRAGYIHPNRSLDFFAVNMFSSPYYFHKGFSIGAGLKKYKIKRFNSSWKYAFAYKYEFFNDEDLWLGGWGGSSSANELYLSQRKNILHFRVEYGLSSKKMGFNTEWFCGLGLNAIHVSTIYHGCRQCDYSPSYNPPITIKDDEKPYLDNGYYVLPTLHLGFRFGGKFRTKK